VYVVEKCGYYCMRGDRLSRCTSRDYAFAEERQCRFSLGAAYSSGTRRKERVKEYFFMCNSPEFKKHFEQ